MTTANSTVSYAAPGLSGPADTPRARRWPVVVTLVLSLLASGALQQFNQDQRAAAPRASTSAATVNNLNSYSLALLLGGLRGPLVMYLWPSIENQKQDKDLDDLDTKIELIRLLQGEYESVLLYQIWNKAYNVSVLMSSNRNKYSVIIDAIDYAQKADRERPDSLNINAAIADVYFNKLGNSNEQEYYTRRMMEDTRWREPTRAAGEAGRGDASIRKTRLDPMLDKDGRILPDLIRPRRDCPDSDDPAGECNDGSELQYLRKFQPFPYGLMPLALGYNYYKRSEVLMNTTHQRHAQMSERIADSRPAVALKVWSEGEYYAGMRLEIKTFGQPVPEDWFGNRGIVCTPTEALGPDLRVDDPAPLREAIYHLRLCEQTADVGEQEYLRSQEHDKSNLERYRNHRDELAARRTITEADAFYLEAVLATDAAERAHKLAASRDAYRRSAEQWRVVMLKFGIRADVAALFYPPGTTRQSVETLPPARAAALVEQFRTQYFIPHRAQMADEAEEYFHYIQRTQRRMEVIDAALSGSRPPASREKAL